MRPNHLFFYFCLICLTACQSEQTEEAVADMVLINGTIATVDAKNPTVEAIAFAADRIIELGTMKDIQKLINDETKVLKK